ncbi:putative membrane protein [Bradyrhizobium liaoningense]
MSTGNEIECARSESEDEPQIFSALLTPHRSLNRTGFLAVMLFLSVVSFVTGLAFLMMGAWPVFGFFGLDVLVIWWAFKVNFRAARASEEIVVTPSELRVRRVSHRGQVAEWTFNPLWVRLDQEIDEEYGIEHLYLISRGRRLLIAGFSRTSRKGKLLQCLSRGPQRCKTWTDV